MVGLIDDEKHVTTQWFKDEGDVIILVGLEPARLRAETDRDEGVATPNLGGSQYLKVCYGLKIGPPPYVDLEHEIKVQNAVRDLIRQGLVKSAHDCSEGGLAVALAESCFNPEKLFGAEIDCSGGPVGRRKETSHSDAATVLFNEFQSRIIISVAPENLDDVISVLRERDVLFRQLGKVCGDELCIRVNNERFAWPIAELHDEWWNSIRRLVESDASAERIPSL